jgi:hypothetical protein
MTAKRVLWDALESNRGGARVRTKSVALKSNWSNSYFYCGGPSVDSKKIIHLPPAYVKSERSVVRWNGKNR